MKEKFRIKKSGKKDNTEEAKTVSQAASEDVQAEETRSGMPEESKAVPEAAPEAVQAETALSGITEEEKAVPEASGGDSQAEEAQIHITEEEKAVPEASDEDLRTEMPPGDESEELHERTSEGDNADSDADADENEAAGKDEKDGKEAEGKPPKQPLTFREKLALIKEKAVSFARKVKAICAQIKKYAIIFAKIVVKICRKIKAAALWLADFYKRKTIPVLITALAVLIVILVFVLLLGAGVEEETQTKYQKWMRQLQTKDIMECQIETINDFFDEYYLALSEGDTTTLESMYDDPLKANITTELSSIVESYSDLTVYVTPGINTGEVAVFVSYDIHFVNIEAATPAVDSFYIMMDSENVCIYIMTDMYTDSDINTFLYLASYRNPIRDLLSDTEEELNEILEEDSELRNIYIIMNAMSEEDSGDDEASESAAAEEETAEEASEETSEEETAEEETAEEETAQEEETESE